MLYSITGEKYDVGIYANNGDGSPLYFYGYEKYSDALQDVKLYTRALENVYGMLRDNTGNAYKFETFENGRAVV